ncbi:hypothetical protein SLA2020_427990 [Shorea laevis]
MYATILKQIYIWSYGISAFTCLSQHRNVPDVEGFNQVLRPLLDKLRKRAASGNSTRKFALESATAPDFQTIYALVECTPDLDQLGCNNCLEWLRDIFHNVVMASREENYEHPAAFKVRDIRFL